jgi:xanthine dehydrogenase YagS FAD-binding subunit
MDSFAWLAPTTIADAATAAPTLVADVMARARTGAAVPHSTILKAGGIDLLDLMKERLLVPETVVSLREIPELDGIAFDEASGLRIGALATLATLAGHPLVRKRYRALADAAAGSASPQIRNVATVGGNLLQRPRCWYFRDRASRCLRKGGEHCFAVAGDNRYHAVFDNRPCAIVHPSTVATALVALGGVVELINAAGKRRQQPLEKFLVAPRGEVTRENAIGPGEILTDIRLPALPAGVRMAQMRQGEKDAFDWPLVDVAVVLNVTAEGICATAAVILGAVAPAPYRARAAEAALIGRRVDGSVAAEAARAALAGATPLAGNIYKLPLLETLVRRTILQSMQV